MSDSKTNSDVAELELSTSVPDSGSETSVDGCPNAATAAAATESKAESKEETTTTEKPPAPWGKLVSFNPSYPSINLFGDMIIEVGRKDPRYHLTNCAFSSVHFCIWREESVASPTGYLTYIRDQSTNGTFLNKERLKKNDRHLLKSESDVSLLDPTRIAAAVTYRYVDLLAEEKEAKEGGPQHAYEFGPVLGSGHFAIVRRVRCIADGKFYALKIMDKARAVATQSGRDPVRDEAVILHGLHHPNIVFVKEIYETKRFFYIVLELVRGGELFDRLDEKKKFDEDTARSVMRQLLDAVCYLHKEGVAHRDIKPENILLEAPETFVVKLSDFGLSRFFDEKSFMKTMCGTPAYVAPEVLTSKGTGGYTTAVDIWSLGVVLYIMLTGYHPFNIEDEKQLFASITKGNFGFPEKLWSGISPSAINLIQRMMTVDPKQRITAADALHHPWILNIPNSELRSDSVMVDDAVAPAALPHHPAASAPATSAPAASAPATSAPAASAPADSAPPESGSRRLAEEDSSAISGVANKKKRDS